MENSSDAVTELYEDQKSPETRQSGVDPGENGARRTTRQEDDGTTAAVLHEDVAETAQPTPGPGAGDTDGHSGQSCGVNIGGRERAASLIAGAALAGAGAFRLTRRSWKSGLPLALAGTGLLYRGATGHCGLYQALDKCTAEEEPHPGIHSEKAVTIDRSPAEIYDFWHDLKNMPRFMPHIQSVTEVGPGHSRWVARAPQGKTWDWMAEVTEDVPDQKIAWRSLPGSDLPNSGSVTFTTAPAGRGTEVRLTLDYDPPLGMVGNAAAMLVGANPDHELEDGLRLLKQLLETGEQATTAGQSAGPRTLKAKAANAVARQFDA